MARNPDSVAKGTRGPRHVCTGSTVTNAYFCKEASVTRLCARVYLFAQSPECPPMTSPMSSRFSLAILAAAFALAPALHAAPLAPKQQAVHVLNRLAFGPRPGDVERVQRIGVQQYIDEQLH